MKDQDESLDLLDLEDDNEVDTLPEATPFSAPRPKRPWLLMGLGLAIVVLATWIVIAHIGGDSSSSVSVNLDAPADKVEVPSAPVADLNVPAKPAKVEVQPKTEKSAPKPIETKPVESDGTPVRVVEDRKEVTFNPDKVTTKSVAQNTTNQKKITAPTVAKKTTTPVATSTGNIYVQFGSYSTRELAKAAEQRIRNAHQSLFSGKQFVILAAEVKGQTIYRLRVPFHTASEANGFCRNAKSDGLDCYVSK